MTSNMFLLNPEALAYWYFRLNGCLCLQNFLIHDRPGREGTDADLIAVRFPYRCELLHTNNPMQDDSVFINNDKIELFIVEVKRGKCSLNGPWTDPQKENMQNGLRAIGIFNKEKIDYVAKQLYKKYTYENKTIRCRLIAMGLYENEELNSVVQITWKQAASFIFDRFTLYANYKSQHHQWDMTGQMLYKMTLMFHNEKEKFEELIIQFMH